MRLLDRLFRTRRWFDQQLDELFVGFDYELKANEIDALLNETDPVGAEARIVEIIRSRVKSEYFCERAGCGGVYLIRSGRYGPFLGCSNYPDCRSTKDAPEELARHERAASFRRYSRASLETKTKQRERARVFAASRRRARERFKYLLGAGH